MTLALVLAACFSLEVADDFVRDARRLYSLPEYASYTNSLVGTGRYAGRTLGADSAVRRPWREGLVRWMDAPRANNIRDIGGWTGLRTGLVYRGSEFDSSKNRGKTDPKNPDKKVYDARDLTDEGRRVFREEMKIRTDLDLRNPKYHTVLGEDVNHVIAPVGSYHRMIASAKGRAFVARALRVFADEKNYPVYVHCAGGADRTGSIIFLLEGLCGVTEPDLSIDYELTSFGGAGGYRQRFDHSYHFASFVACMKACPGATLTDQIRWYVTHELGLTDAEVDAIRRILIAPADYSTDIVLASGAVRYRLGLDGRLKPSQTPFVSLRLKDGTCVPCTFVADDARGDLYFGFSKKGLGVVLGTELTDGGLTFPVRSFAPADAQVVITDLIGKGNGQ